jgi:ubiquinone/menaquinone biosynthesis C-methylase UbiE
VTIDWRVKAFDLGAGIYGFLTEQSVWDRANRDLVAHFPEPTARICDMGCGTGATALAEARACPTAEVTGVDISPAMIAKARVAVAHAEPEVQRRVAVQVGDAAHLPFEDGAFDVVTGHSFLYLVPHRAEVLREVVRILRPGGRAIFMEPRKGDFSLPRLLALGLDPRFLTSMMLWRVAARMNVRFTEETLPALLAEAGLAPLGAHPVLAGLGLIAVAEKRTT